MIDAKTFLKPSGIRKRINCLSLQHETYLSFENGRFQFPLYDIPSSFKCTSETTFCFSRSAFNEDSDQSLCCPHAEFFILGFPKCAREDSDHCANTQADLTLSWAHMSKGTFYGFKFVFRQSRNDQYLVIMEFKHGSKYQTRDTCSICCKTLLYFLR